MDESNRTMIGPENGLLFQSITPSVTVNNSYGATLAEENGNHCQIKLT